jgi:Xaa-Pro aminopeptidase
MMVHETGGDGMKQFWILFVGIIAVVAILRAEEGRIDEELRNDLIRRRAEISEAIGPDSMLIVFSAPQRPKTNDVLYEYRQGNNLFYLTGITQEDTILVLLPGSKNRKEFLFIQDRNPAAEVWTGKILSTEEVRNISGVQNVFSTNRFSSFINSILRRQPFEVNRYVPSDEYDPLFDKLIQGTAKIYLSFENASGVGEELSKEQEFASELNKHFTGFQIRDAWPHLTRMRQVKSAHEVKMLREAVDITCEALQQVYRRVEPGMWEYEAEAIVEGVFKKGNAFDWGFPSIIASGPNATTLHYEDSQRKMQDGDLLLMDVGAEYRYYSADVTRTIPVNGKFTKEQAEIYQIVFDAQEAAMKLSRPGAKLPDVHLAGTEVVKQGLKRLGLITDTTNDQYKMFFMHGVSHWLGMDVHDTGERWRPLEPGMVYTIEPGIYVREDALVNLPSTPENEKLKAAILPAWEKYKNIGVRIEDDILITENGHEVLSKSAPRTIAEIEAMMKN